MPHAALSMPIVQATIERMKELGDLVRVTRERIGLGTQRDLAEAIGKDPSWVSRLERGLLKEMPTPSDMAALSHTLRLSQLEMLRAGGYSIPLEPEGSSGPVRRLAPVIDTYEWDDVKLESAERMLRTIGEMYQGTYAAQNAEE